MNIDLLLTQSDFQRFYLGLLVDDIAADQFTQQPGKVVNHPAWQIGHLADVTDMCVQLVGGEKRLDDSWGKLFAGGSTPVADASKYPTKAKLIETYDERRNALIRRCKELSAAEWQKLHPIPQLKMLPTVGHAISFMMLTHESTHLGQLATWRHAQGLPMALSKLSA